MENRINDGALFGWIQLWTGINPESNNLMSSILINYFLSPFLSVINSYPFLLDRREQIRASNRKGSPIAPIHPLQVGRSVARWGHGKSPSFETGDSKPEQTGGTDRQKTMSSLIVKVMNKYLTSFIREVASSDLQLSLLNGSLVLNNIVVASEQSSSRRS